MASNAHRPPLAVELPVDADEQVLHRMSRLWRTVVSDGNGRLRRWLMLVTWMLVALIGIVDFLIGFEVSLLVFYFLPIALAVVIDGPRFGFLVAIISVGTWVAGDIAAGARYATPVVPIWNAVIAFITDAILIWLLGALLSFQRQLEHGVQRRTAALAAEVAERERLEREVLEISERERRSIGHDLHDGLGQHLTGTAIRAQMLADKLRDDRTADVADAKRVVALVKHAIEQTRQMAKGLLLADIDAGALAPALAEFAQAISEQFRVTCTVSAEGEARAMESGTASQLFRIAQEAVRNAVRHGRASRIEIRLRAAGRATEMVVTDNGTGIGSAATRGDGLGLRIMAHRARLIGADFSIGAAPAGGTTVTCSLPFHS